MIYREPVRLNLGCGHDFRLGWTNVDVNPEIKADLHHDLNDCLPFPSDYADEVLISHVIEHLSYKKGGQLINEIFRVLRKDGILRISTPNLRYVLEHDLSDPLMINNFAYGCGETRWQTHYALYTVDMLRRKLQKFRTVQEVFVWHEIRLEAQK